MCLIRRLPKISIGFFSLLLAGSACAQTSIPPLQLRALAATCASCHGTDGNAVEGAGSLALRGLGREYIAQQLIAFRSDTRPATVMHQLIKGYTPEQVEQLAAYFSASR